MKQIQIRADKVEYDHARIYQTGAKPHGGARKERARKEPRAQERNSERRKGTASAGKETAVVRKGKEQCERSFEKGRNSASGR
eukprot:267166-Prorocentrum_minimum.AAC.1